MAHSACDVRRLPNEKRIGDGEFLHIIADVLASVGEMELAPEDVLRLEHIAAWVSTRRKGRKGRKRNVRWPKRRPEGATQ